MSEPSQRFEQGMATRRAVLGDHYVDAASAAVTELDAEFQTFLTETAWGALWTRTGISKRERSMITIALLAGLGHHQELAVHVRATRNTGTSLADIREALMHVAVYAGVPAANAAFKVAKTALAEMETSE